MDARRKRILVAISVPLIMVGIDGTILNVALPTIARDLNTTSSELVWINSAYIIMFGSTILISASIGDKFGRKRVLQLGMAVFILGSVMSGLSDAADSATFLIVARAIQGLGAGAIPPSTLSLIRSTFEDEKERARAIGVWAGMSAIGIAVGPVLGGLILNSTSAWGWIFYINVPIVILGQVLIFRRVEESKDPAAAPIDAAGALLSMAGLFALFYGLIEGPEQRLGLGGGDRLIRPRGRPPHVLRLLRAAQEIPAARPATVQVGALHLGGARDRGRLPRPDGARLRAHPLPADVRDYSPLKAGVSLVPFAVALMIVAPLAPKIAEKRGDRLTVMAGMVMLGAGMLVLLAAGTDSSYLVVLISLLCAGAGVSLVQPPASAAMMSSVSAAKAGMASGTNAAIRQIGASFGIAVMGGIGQSVFSQPPDRLEDLRKTAVCKRRTAADSSISGADRGRRKSGWRARRRTDRSRLDRFRQRDALGRDRRRRLRRGRLPDRRPADPEARRGRSGTARRGRGG